MYSSSLNGNCQGIHFYGVEGRRGCSAMEGKKSILSFRRGYVFVATQDEASGTLARKHSSDMTDSYRSMLNVYDIRNNLIVFSDIFGRITHVLSEWGSIFVIAQEKRPDQAIMHRIYQLDEKDTQTKLDTLFRKNLYHVAISLAKGQHFDEVQIADIHKKHGDHLYSKMAFDGAVTEYIETIKHLEPSYVIRGFLDAQRIEGLRRYLEALHAKKVATADHTTLLINCYTKLKDSEKLDEFIRSHSEVHYDVETAIRVCRQARNFPQSLFLALRHDEHDWVVKILVEDMERFEEALEYIHSLQFIIAEHFMKSYGKVLCTNLSKETTSLMMELCTEYHMTPLSGSRSQLAQTFESAQAWKESVDADKDAGDEEEEETMSTVSGSVATVSMSHSHPSAPNVEDSRSKLLGFGTGSSLAPRSVTASQVAAETEGAQIRRLSSADEFLHAFVDQPQWLMVFLEFVTTHCQNASTRSFNALFELYLQLDVSLFYNLFLEVSPFPILLLSTCVS
jgi:vacuolar protein sorting-associated protein 11